jgi:hypothetical protein
MNKNLHRFPVKLSDAAISPPVNNEMLFIKLKPSSLFATSQPYNKISPLFVKDKPIRFNSEA